MPPKKRTPVDPWAQVQGLYTSGKYQEAINTFYKLPKEELAALTANRALVVADCLVHLHQELAAVVYLNKYASVGHLEALFQKAKLHLSLQNNVLINQRDGFSALKQAACLGHIGAMKCLADAYELGVGHPQDSMMAEEWRNRFKANCQDKKSQEQYPSLRNFYSPPVIIENVPLPEGYPELSDEMFHQMIEGESIESSAISMAYILGHYHYKHKKNPPKAENYLLRAASLGVQPAIELLAEFYIEYEECPQGVSLHYICIAAYKGNKAALDYILQQADKGYHQAAFAWGYICERGYGRQSDIDEAKRYYEMAAEQGNAEALVRLAKFNNQTPQEVEYYARAALRGSAEAMHWLYQNKEVFTELIVDADGKFDPASEEVQRKSFALYALYTSKIVIKPAGDDIYLLRRAALLGSPLAFAALLEVGDDLEKLKRIYPNIYVKHPAIIGVQAKKEKDPTKQEELYLRALEEYDRQKLDDKELKGRIYYQLYKIGSQKPQSYEQEAINYGYLTQSAENDCLEAYERLGKTIGVDPQRQKNNLLKAVNLEYILAFEVLADIYAVEKKYEKALYCYNRCLRWLNEQTSLLEATKPDTIRYINLETSINVRMAKLYCVMGYTAETLSSAKQALVGGNTMVYPIIAQQLIADNVLSAHGYNLQQVIGLLKGSIYHRSLDWQARQKKLLPASESIGEDSGVINLTLKSGKQSQEQGHFSLAKEHFLTAAKQGNVEAMWLYARLCIIAPNDCKPDLMSGVLYLKRAAYMNHPNAAYWFGIILSRGVGVYQNNVEGERFINIAKHNNPNCGNDKKLNAAIADIEKSRASLRNRIYHDEMTPEQMVEVIDSGTDYYGDAAYHLGMHHWLEGSDNEALNYFFKASSQCHFDASKALLEYQEHHHVSPILGHMPRYICALNGDVSAKDKIEKLAQEGDSDSRNYMAYFKLFGLAGVKQDVAEAIKLLKINADLKDVHALLLLESLYTHQHGVNFCHTDIQDKDIDQYRRYLLAHGSYQAFSYYASRQDEVMSDADLCFLFGQAVQKVECDKQKAASYIIHALHLNPNHTQASLWAVHFMNTDLAYTNERAQLLYAGRKVNDPEIMCFLAEPECEIDDKMKVLGQLVEASVVSAYYPHAMQLKRLHGEVNSDVLDSLRKASDEGHKDAQIAYISYYVTSRIFDPVVDQMAVKAIANGHEMLWLHYGRYKKFEARNNPEDKKLLQLALYCFMRGEEVLKTKLMRPDASDEFKRVIHKNMRQCLTDIYNTAVHLGADYQALLPSYKEKIAAIGVDLPILHEVLIGWKNAQPPQLNKIKNIQSELARNNPNMMFLVKGFCESNRIEALGIMEFFKKKNQNQIPEPFTYYYQELLDYKAKADELEKQYKESPSLQNLMALYHHYVGGNCDDKARKCLTKAVEQLHLPALLIEAKLKHPDIVPQGAAIENLNDNAIEKLIGYYIANKQYNIAGAWYRQLQSPNPVVIINQLFTDRKLARPVEKAREVLGQLPCPGDIITRVMEVVEGNDSHAKTKWESLLKEATYEHNDVTSIFALIEHYKGNHGKLNNFLQLFDNKPSAYAICWEVSAKPQSERLAYLDKKYKKYKENNDPRQLLVKALQATNPVEAQEQYNQYSSKLTNAPKEPLFNSFWQNFIKHLELRSFAKSDYYDPDGSIAYMLFKSEGRQRFAFIKDKDTDWLMVAIGRGHKDALQQRIMQDLSVAPPADQRQDTCAAWLVDAAISYLQNDNDLMVQLILKHHVNRHGLVTAIDRCLDVAPSDRIRALLGNICDGKASSIDAILDDCIKSLPKNHPLKSRLYSLILDKEKYTDPFDEDFFFPAELTGAMYTRVGANYAYSVG